MNQYLEAQEDDDAGNGDDAAANIDPELLQGLQNTLSGALAELEGESDSDDDLDKLFSGDDSESQAAPVVALQTEVTTKSATRPAEQQPAVPTANEPVSVELGQPDEPESPEETTESHETDEEAAGSQYQAQEEAAQEQKRYGKGAGPNGEDVWRYVEPVPGTKGPTMGIPERKVPYEVYQPESNDKENGIIAFRSDPPDDDTTIAWSEVIKAGDRKRTMDGNPSRRKEMHSGVRMQEAEERWSGFSKMLKWRSENRKDTKDKQWVVFMGIPCNTAAEYSRLAAKLESTEAAMFFKKIGTAAHVILEVGIPSALPVAHGKMRQYIEAVRYLMTKYPEKFTVVLSDYNILNADPADFYEDFDVDKHFDAKFRDADDFLRLYQKSMEDLSDQAEHADEARRNAHWSAKGERLPRDWRGILEEQMRLYGEYKEKYKEGQRQTHKGKCERIQEEIEFCKEFVREVQRSHVGRQFPAEILALLPDSFVTETKSQEVEPVPQTPEVPQSQAEVVASRATSPEAESLLAVSAPENIDDFERRSEAATAQLEANGSNGNSQDLIQSIETQQQAEDLAVDPPNVRRTVDAASSKKVTQAAVYIDLTSPSPPPVHASLAGETHKPARLPVDDGPASGAQKLPEQVLSANKARAEYSRQLRQQTAAQTQALLRAPSQALHSRPPAADLAGLNGVDNWPEYADGSNYIPKDAVDNTSPFQAVSTQLGHQEQAQLHPYQAPYQAEVPRLNMGSNPTTASQPRLRPNNDGFPPQPQPAYNSEPRYNKVQNHMASSRAYPGSPAPQLLQGTPQNPQPSYLNIKGQNMQPNGRQMQTPTQPGQMPYPFGIGQPMAYPNNGATVQQQAQPHNAGSSPSAAPKLQVPEPDYEQVYAQEPLHGPQLRSPYIRQPQMQNDDYGLMDPFGYGNPQEYPYQQLPTPVPHVYGQMPPAYGQEYGYGPFSGPQDLPAPDAADMFYSAPYQLGTPQMQPSPYMNNGLQQMGAYNGYGQQVEQSRKRGREDDATEKEGAKKAKRYGVAF